MADLMRCRDAVERLWAYLDGELDEADRGALEAHLGTCLRCCGEVAFARQLQDTLVSRGRPDLPTSVRRRLEGFIDRLEPERPTTGADHD